VNNLSNLWEAQLILRLLHNVSARRYNGRKHFLQFVANTITFLQVCTHTRLEIVSCLEERKLL
jgi:hypothetical protein